MEKSRVDEEDVMEAARLSQGLTHMREISYAVLEKDGTISIVPKQKKEP